MKTTAELYFHFKMKTARRQSCDEKEPFGPGSRDYFWLVCRLVDNIKKDDAVKSWQEVRKNMFTEVLLMLDVNILQIQLCLLNQRFTVDLFP